MTYVVDDTLTRVSKVISVPLANDLIQGASLDVKKDGKTTVYNAVIVNAYYAIVSSGAFIVDNRYTIVTVGSTDFTLIGAADNEVGTSFRATGVGEGTGTASEAIASPGSVIATAIDVDVDGTYTLTFMGESAVDLDTNKVTRTKLGATTVRKVTSNTEIKI